ncbi:ABC transporter permease [Isoptericola sp. G70]|uniref:ABC transporter permease n=1 Tax=Isoptericola sp. G70 TaxID=3376633 RepID=UPI003A7F7E94
MTTHVLTDTRVLTGRSLRHISRSPDTILTTAVTPIALMLLFVYVFGGAIDTGSDESYLDYMLPGILLITIASGIAYAAYRLFLDLQGGIFERFRSMPIARSSVLWGHVLTSLVANLASIGIVIGVALLLGFRTGASVGAWLAVAGILGLFTLSLTWLAENQPVTSIVDTLRALFAQQSPGADIWVALAWLVGILTVAHAAAIAAYRRKTG